MALKVLAGKWGNGKLGIWPLIGGKQQQVATYVGGIHGGLSHTGFPCWILRSVETAELFTLCSFSPVL